MDTKSKELPEMNYVFTHISNTPEEDRKGLCEEYWVNKPIAGTKKQIVYEDSRYLIIFDSRDGHREIIDLCAQ